MKRQSLTWEWPAGRSPVRQARARLTEIRPAKGPLGLPISPSLPNGFVDPVRIDGVFAGEAGGRETPFRLIAPGPEATGLAVGQVVVLECLDADVVIGVRVGSSAA